MTDIIIAESGPVVVYEADGKTYVLTEENAADAARSADRAAAALGGIATFLLTSAGSAIGPGIADFFGANSSVSLEASTTYEIEVFAYFLKSTAGTLTWTWLASSALTMISSTYEGNATGGFDTTATTGSQITGEAAIQTNTVLAHGATGSLTSAKYHEHRLRARLKTNAACNLRLRATCGAGTITPQGGSFYRVTKIAALGSFVA